MGAPHLVYPSPTDGHLGCCHPLAAVNGAAVNGDAFCPEMYPGELIPTFMAHSGVQSGLSSGVTGAWGEAALGSSGLSGSQAPPFSHITLGKSRQLWLHFLCLFGGGT